MTHPSFLTLFCEPIAHRRQRLSRHLVPWLLAVVTALGFPPGVVAQAGTPPFSQSIFLGSRHHTNSVAVGDLDGDGALDIVQGNWLGESYLYLNDGQGGFPTSGQHLGSGQSTFSVAVGDLNGDGALDIVQGNFVEQSYLYLNDGRGGFPTTGQLWGSSQPTRSVAVGDLDGDGDLDIVQGNDGQSYLYLNDGQGGFPTTGQLWGSSQPTRSVAVGDLDGDGDLDIVQGNDGQQSYLYLNDGQGGFPASGQLLGSEQRTYSVAVGDLDGDGVLDIVQGNVGQSYLYLNDGQGGFPASGQLLGSEQSTTSVAVGDLNGDGTLDIVQGNDGQQSYLYLNDGQGNFLTDGQPWGSRQRPFSVAVGDLNGDGALDIVQGNYNQQSYIYLNDGQGGFTGSGQLWGSGQRTSSVAVGDLNGDGDLDIVQGSDGQQSYLYLNDGQGNFPTDGQPWGSGQPTRSVAVGDLDGDGALDIVQGNYDQQSYIYLNDGQGGFPGSRQSWGSGQSTTSVAVGDFNGDGALDIVQGNFVQQSYLYLNDGRGGFLESGQPWGSSQNTYSVAVGDLNGDGALDIVQGNYPQSYLYLNDGQGNFPASDLALGNEQHTFSVAVGDLNGDGALDIVQGNYLSQSYLYLNDGQGNFPASDLALGNEQHTFSVAVGDLNGDGALDIVQGNGDSLYPEQGYLYLNNGEGDFPATGLAFGNGQRTRSLAVGDLNSDGALDIVQGAIDQSYIHLNRRLGATGLPNNAPRIAVIRPGHTANANFFSSPTILANPTIPISYTLFDPESDPVGRVEAWYSLDGGGKWLPALPAPSTTITNLATAPVGVEHLYTWDTFRSGFFGQSDNVVIRLVAHTQTNTPAAPGTYLYRNRTPGPYQWPSANATTFPFRVRGTQVRVLQGGDPQPNALVYRLPAGQNNGAQPLTNSGNSQPFRTNRQGYLPGRGRIILGDTLVALLPQPLPPALTIPYSGTLRFFQTSAIPGLPAGTASRVTQPGVQSLTVADQQPLLLFDLTIALEWDARKDAQFLSQLEFDLKRASELLYTWSHGQAALANLTVYHDAPHTPPTDQGWQPWEDAQIRIYATNHLRPNASQGGFISQPLTTTSAVGTPLTYTPGQVRMGAVWNRTGDAASNLAEDWPRALAHELGHYLFFLADNYLGLNDQGLLTPLTTCPGVMSDPYSDRIPEFHPATAWLPGCAQSLAQHETGRADWQTIQTFYPMLRAPTGPITQTIPPPPRSLPLAVTQVTFQEPPTPSQTLDFVRISLLTSDGAALPSSNARAILYQPAASLGDRLIDLGRPTLDQVQAYGARLGDELCLYDQANQQVGCQLLSAADNQLVLTPSDWQPELVITPVTSTTLQLTVTGVGPLTSAATLYARFYPLEGVATPALALASTTGGYTATLVLAQSTLSGYLRLWVGSTADATKVAPLRDLVTDFSLGGNPVPTAQKKRPAGKKRKKAPLLSPDGQVTLYTPDNQTFAPGEFYALQATSAITPPVWATVVGQAYRLLASPQAPSLAHTSLSFEYLASDVPPGQEQFLHLYFWDSSPRACGIQPAPCWRLLPTELDHDHNVAVAPVQGPGLYALMSSVELPLHGSAWNYLIATAQSTQPLSTALQSIAADYSMVWSYDPTAPPGAEPWQLYAPAVPAWVNNLTMLDFGRGYWLHITATQSITLYLNGGGATAAASIAAAPPLPAIYYGPVLPSATLTPTAGLTVTAWIDGHACGQTHTRTTAPDGNPAIVYLLRVTGVAVNPLCGQPQSIVTFTLNGQPVTTTTPVRWDNTRVQEVTLQTSNLLATAGSTATGAPDTPDLTDRLFLPLPGNEVYAALE